MLVPPKKEKSGTKRSLFEEREFTKQGRRREVHDKSTEKRTMVKLCLTESADGFKEMIL